MVEEIQKLSREAILKIVGLQTEKTVVVPQSCEVREVEILLTRCQRDGAWKDTDSGELACMPHKRPMQNLTILVTIVVILKLTYS